MIGKLNPFDFRKRYRNASLTIGLSVLFSLVICAVGMAETYSIERIFATTTEISGNFSRQKIDLGETGLSFSTITDDSMDIWTELSPPKEGVIARIYYPESRDKLMIEVQRVSFGSFADAKTAGYGFLALSGYNRILIDTDNTNSAFGFLAASEFKEGTGFGRMSRLAAISHGLEVLIIQATFNYEDYPRYEDALSRFFGGIQMENDSKAFKSLKQETAKDGEVFLYPRDWELRMVDSSNMPEGTSDYNLSFAGEEYPNLVVHIRPVGLAKGKDIAVDMVSTFTKQIDDSSQASFVGQADMETIKSPSGKTLAHSYARGWDTSGGGHFVAEIYVQKNIVPSSISIVGLNTYDARRDIGSFDEEARQIIFKGWVTGVSAYSVVKMSLTHDEETLSKEFDLRAVGR